MNPAEFSLKHKTFIVCSIIFILIGGVYAYFQLGKLEDPKFSIKTAVVVTRYPGASPAEVEQQVTDTIEKAVQQLGELDYIRSISRAGASIIFVDIKESCRADKLPQIWDELRRKIHDIQPQLPPGASPSEVRDDFGDVYGIFLALTGDGFSTAELKDYANIIQRELLMVKDVARVELWGVQRECIYVDISRSRLSELGIRPEQIVATLRDQNMIIDPGSVDLGTQRIRLAPSGTFDTTSAIGDLVISGPESTDLVLLKDIADIRRGYLTPPLTLMRYNGKPGIGIAISTVSGGNVIAMGDAVKKRLSQLMLDFPAGIDIGTISYQSETVRESVNTFIINLAESVAIVIGVLLLAMGLRSGLLIGGGLILSILGSFIVMMFMGIDLQRTSLGALIIAMGMLVDNAIVVTEGSLVRLQMGEDRRTAATAPATNTAWPLLAATLVAILAFIPIKLSNRAVGEYCESLFQVVGISLFISWILAMTATPVFCERFLRIKPSRQTSDPYAGRTFQLY
ncbi:MAG: efflux RND transporter permease subunit, partial [Desulfobacterales bacterium]